MSNKTPTRSFKKLSMEEAAAYIYGMGIKSYAEFQQLSKDGLRPPFLPSALYSYYPDYPGWEEFLKLGETLSRRKPQDEQPASAFTIDYYELKHIVKTKRISSVYAFHKARRNNELPLGTPPYPEKFYPEFEGWDEFLSSEPSRLSYEDAKALIHPFKLKSGYQWRNFCREGLKPDGIPVLPDRDYAEFISWADFLGFDEPKD